MASKGFTTGSFRELWRVTYPLMISSLSTFAMITVDRYFLGLYSKEAMNASTAAGTFVWAIILAWTTMAMMAEVFVAQFNGAKKYEKLGTPVWQMIWFSLLSFAFFIPFGIWGHTVAYSADTQPMQVEYTRWMMFAGPPFVVLNAVSAFFIGQGKTSIIRWMALLGNLVNVVLDPLLIFGYKGIIPAMGIPGACIATGIGAIVQVVVLWKVFMNKKNRENHGTGNWKLDLSIFKGCLRVGFPPALSVGLEVMGWAAFYKMMSECGQIHIDSATISQTILMIFLFFGFALEKGCATVAGNLIGGGLINKMKRLMKSGMTLLFAYSVLLVVFLVIFPDMLIDIFTQHHISNAATGEVPLVQLGIMAKVKEVTRIGLMLSVIYVTLENMRWVFTGILTAAGDTFFLLMANVASVWLFLILPTYFFVMKTGASIKYAYVIWVGYGLFSMGVVYLRYKRGKWKEKKLIEDTPEPEAEPAAISVTIEDDEIDAEPS